MVSDAVREVVAAIERAVVGRRTELEALLAAFLAEGHVLLEGAPGTAKTLVVRALAAASGCAFRRIQFTPDLMPADVTGTNIYDAKEGAFRLMRGPIFTDILLADEVNRAPAKTQAALLECMEEHNATIDGTTYPLPKPFTVFATMNPVEFEGTFPLPEAQLDRFLMKVPMGELNLAAEQEVIARFVAGFDPWALATAGIEPVLDADKLQELRAAVRAVSVEAHVQTYLVEVVRRTRTHPAVSLGASTRAGVALMRASRARAACEGRDYVIPDDIKFLASYVLAHRLSMRPEAQLEDVDGRRIVAEILNAVPVPRA
jgi:MoxR-like ATPase